MKPHYKIRLFCIFGDVPPIISMYAFAGRNAARWGTTRVNAALSRRMTPVSANPPARPKALARGARKPRCVGLGCRAYANQRTVGDVWQHVPALARIDHGGADEIGRRAGNGEKRGGV